MKCPSCVVPLTMSERQGIEIEYCPECRGVWLDRGELDKIIERNVPATGMQAGPHFDGPGYYPPMSVRVAHRYYRKIALDWLIDVLD